MDKEQIKQIAQDIEKICLSNKASNLAQLLEMDVNLNVEFPYFFMASFSKACNAQNKEATVLLANCSKFKTKHYQNDIKTGFMLLYQEPVLFETLKYFLENVEEKPNDSLLVKAYLYQCGRAQIKGAELLKSYLKTPVNLKPTFINACYLGDIKAMQYMIDECGLKITEELKDKINEKLKHRSEKLEKVEKFLFSNKLNNHLFQNTTPVMRKKI